MVQNSRPDPVLGRMRPDFTIGPNYSGSIEMETCARLPDRGDAAEISQLAKEIISQQQKTEKYGMLFSNSAVLGEVLETQSFGSQSFILHPTMGNHVVPVERRRRNSSTSFRTSSPHTSLSCSRRRSLQSS